MKKLLLVLLIFVLAYANGAGRSEKRDITKDFQTAGLKKSLDNDFLRAVNDLRSRDLSEESWDDRTKLPARISAKQSKSMKQNFLSKANTTDYRPVTVELDYLDDETGKYTYSYDNDGNVTEELYDSFYYGVKEWAEKYYYTYDNNGNLLTETYQYQEDDTWSDEERYTYTYDNMGKIQSELYEEFYDGIWEKVYNDIYTWEDGNIIELLEQEWDGSVWVDRFKISATYDDDNNLLQLIYSNYEDESWVTQEILSWTYDENGNILTSIMEVTDESGTLQYDTRESMSYDINGNLTVHLIEQWVDGDWYIYLRVIMTYAENGDVLTETVEVYDEESGDMQNAGSYSYEYTYDDQGNLTEVVDAVTIQEYTLFTKQIYNFDANNNCFQAECFDSFDSTNWEDGEAYMDLFFNNGADMLSLYAHEVIVNYDGSTSLEDEFKVATKIALDQNYPNPFNPATTISFTLPAKSSVKLTVFNGLGQKVDEIVNSKLSSGVHIYSFDSSGLNSGVYFYKLQSDDNHIVKKMILIK